MKEIEKKKGKNVRERERENRGITFASAYAIGVISCRAKSVFHIILPSTSFAAVNHETRRKRAKRSGLLLNRETACKKGNVTLRGWLAGSLTPPSFSRCLCRFSSAFNYLRCIEGSPGVISIIAIPTNASSVVGWRVGNFRRFFSTAISTGPRADSSGVISERGDTSVEPHLYTDATGMHVPVSRYTRFSNDFRVERPRSFLSSHYNVILYFVNSSEEVTSWSLVKKKSWELSGRPMDRYLRISVERN